MLIWSVALESLRVICSDFFPTANDCDALLKEALIGTVYIDFSEPSYARWGSILVEVSKMGQRSMVRFVGTILRRYPESEEMRAACAPWTPSVNATAPANDPTVTLSEEENKTIPANPTIHPANPTIGTARGGTTGLIPVMVPAEFQEDADRLIERMKALLLIVKEQDVKINALESWRKSFVSNPISSPPTP